MAQNDGDWNVWATPRRNITASTSPTDTPPPAISATSASTSAISPTRASDAMQTTLRLKRSATTPATGLSSAIGRNATMPAAPITTGDDVSAARYQTSANWTAELPTSDTA